MEGLESGLSFWCLPNLYCATFSLKEHTACSKEAKDSRHPASTSWFIFILLFFVFLQSFGEKVCYDDEITIYVFFFFFFFFSESRIVGIYGKFDYLKLFFFQVAIPFYISTRKA